MPEAYRVNGTRPGGAPPAAGAAGVLALHVEQLDSLLGDAGIQGDHAVLDLSSADLDQLQRWSPQPAPAERIVLAAGGWAWLRVALPLLRLVWASKEITVLLEDAGWSETDPRSAWTPLRQGQSPGAYFQVRTDEPINLHAVVTRRLYGPVGTHLAAAHGLRVGLLDRCGEAWAAGDFNALPISSEGLADSLLADVAAAGDVLIAPSDVAASTAALSAAPPVLAAPPSAQHPISTRGPGWTALAVSPRQRLRWPQPASSGVPRVVELSPLPPVDTGAVNPSGFKNRSLQGIAEVRPGRRAGMLRVDFEDTTLFELAHGAPLGPEHLSVLRRRRALRDATNVHPGPLEHARWLSQLAVAGVPVILDRLPEAVRRLLGDELAGVLVQGTESMFADDFQREAHSVASRRIAYRLHGIRQRWAATRAALPLGEGAAPTISVILSTRRPEQIEHAIRQVELQEHVSVELVLALHGDASELSRAQSLARAASIPVQVLQVDPDVVFGEVLNRATALCSGDLVSKMDDDDWYGPLHLYDLLTGLEYSGATLIGRPAEFIHLEGIDVTVRRMGQGCERVADQVPGAALMLRRDDLKELGGWRPTSRAIDRFVCRQVRESGGLVYRQHGFGFMVSRREHGHTWDLKNNRFLRGAAAQWRGARLDIATADLAFDSGALSRVTNGA